MTRFALIIALSALSVSPAIASVYFTDTPASADVWVMVTTTGPAADCWIYSGDVVETPSGSDVWLYRTDTAASADKWVVITDNPNAADQLSCLKKD
ncbi:hypothetical protein [Mesorhizobium sp. M0701]|uniref:hypothetical protein n=1 Tax=Mesorhizobium sp. M0701 TaxID=2956989 RepID=UPI00333D8354